MNLSYDSDARRLSFELDTSLGQHAQSAMVRLQVLFPQHDFSLTNEGFSVENIKLDEVEAMKSVACHTLYREKIYTETLTMRQALMSAVMQR